MSSSTTPKARGLRESHSCKLSTGKEVLLRVDGSFGRARGYPNGLRWIAFSHDVAWKGGIDLSRLVSQEEWPEFLAFLERILADLSERFGVSFVAERGYQRNLGMHSFEKHGDD